LPSPHPAMMICRSPLFTRTATGWIAQHVTDS
jgi:hypothetical protein